MLKEKQEIDQKSQMGTCLRYDYNKKNDNFDSPRSLSSTDAIIIIDDDDEDVQTLETKNKKKKPRLGSWWDYDDAFNELSCVVKGSQKLNNNNEKDDVLSSKAVSCFSSTEEKEKKKKKDVVERSLSSTHHVFIDLGDDDKECVTENNTDHTSKGVNEEFRHVTLEDLGVSVEDLKSIPMEAFDPTWEIKSVAMDPWLGPCIQNLSPR